MDKSDNDKSIISLKLMGSFEFKINAESLEITSTEKQILALLALAYHGLYNDKENDKEIVRSDETLVIYVVQTEWLNAFLYPGVEDEHARDRLRQQVKKLNSKIQKKIKDQNELKDQKKKEISALESGTRAIGFSDDFWNCLELDLVIVDIVKPRKPNSVNLVEPAKKDQAEKAIEIPLEESRGLLDEWNYRWLQDKRIRDIRARLDTDYLERAFKEAKVLRLGLLDNRSLENYEKIERLIEQAAKRVNTQIAIARQAGIEITEQSFPPQVQGLLQIWREISGIPRPNSAIGELAHSFGANKFNLLGPDKNFILRDGLLSDMHSRLIEHRKLALTGVPGLGKTESAISYAHQYSISFYSYILFIHASDTATIEDDIEGIWPWLFPTKASSRSKRNDVARWLANTPNVLLILDNVDDDWSPAEELLKSFNGNQNGYVLLTTQDTKLTAQDTQQSLYETKLPLPPMDDEMGVTFLLRLGGLLKENQSLEEISEDVRKDALKLVKDLDGLPLSLVLAATALANGVSISEFYKDYEKAFSTYRTKVASHTVDGNKPGTRYHRKIYAVYKVVFDRVQSHCPAAADLLRTAAVLAPDVVPEFLFLEGCEALGDDLRKAKDDRVWNEIIRPAALHFGLIRSGQATHSTRKPTLFLHRELKRTLCELMDRKVLERWKRRAVEAAAKAFPDDPVVDYEDALLLLPHARVLCAIIQENRWQDASAQRVLLTTARYLMARGNYKDAEAVLNSISEEEANDASKIDLFGNRGELYIHMARYEEAKREFEILIRVPSIDPKIRTNSLNNLAIALIELKMYEDAEQALSEALPLSKVTFGETDFTTGGILNTWGKLCFHWAAQLKKEEETAAANDHFNEAAQHFEAALTILETEDKSGGTTAYIRANLALIYLEQNKIADAERLGSQAFEQRREIYGNEDHEHMAHSWNVLGKIKQAQGKIEEARVDFAQSLKILSALMGEDYPRIQEMRANLEALNGEDGSGA